MKFLNRCWYLCIPLILVALSLSGYSSQPALAHTLTPMACASAAIGISYVSPMPNGVMNFIVSIDNSCAQEVLTGGVTINTTETCGGNTYTTSRDLQLVSPIQPMSYYSSSYYTLNASCTSKPDTVDMNVQGVLVDKNNITNTEAVSFDTVTPFQ